jgi:hypothetical protein
MPKFENFTTPFITAHCHFNSAHFLLITAHFVYHCTLKKALPSGCNSTIVDKPWHRMHMCSSI